MRICLTFAEVIRFTLGCGSRCYYLENTLTFDLKEIRALKFQISRSEIINR